MDLLNQSFGSGGMKCGLDQNILPYFIQNLKRQGDLPTKKAIMRPGLQEGSDKILVGDIIPTCSS